MPTNAQPWVMQKTDGLIDNNAIKAGTFNKIFSYTVQPTELLKIGNGPDRGIQDSLGRVFMEIHSTASGNPVVTGVYQITIENLQGMVVAGGTIGQWHTSQFATGESDWTKQRPWPALKGNIPENCRLCIYLMPDADATVDITSSKMYMSMTKVYTRV